MDPLSTINNLLELHQKILRLIEAWKSIRAIPKELLELEGRVAVLDDLLQTLPRDIIERNQPLRRLVGNCATSLEKILGFIRETSRRLSSGSKAKRCWEATKVWDQKRMMTLREITGQLQRDLELGIDVVLM